MGNKTSSTLAVQAYAPTKQQSHIPASQPSVDSICSLWPIDVLSVAIPYCQRAEQVALMELLFYNLSSPKQKKDINALFHQVEIRSLVDPYMIVPFNKSNKILSHVAEAADNAFKFFFTNITLKGSQENIDFLVSNEQDIMYAFIHNIAYKKKDILKAANDHESIPIDQFVEAYKNRRVKEMSFNASDTFMFDDEKLENIKYRNAFKFHQVCRLCVDDEQVQAFSWKQLNRMFIEYLITNQLNFVCDSKASKHKFINPDIDLSNEETLNVLCGNSLYDDPLIAYSLDWRESKHTSFVGATQYKTYRKEKKIYITTKKMSTVFIVNRNKKTKNINVITAMNPSSEDHISDDFTLGKRMKHVAFDQYGLSGM